MQGRIGKGSVYRIPFQGNVCTGKIPDKPVGTGERHLGKRLMIEQRSKAQGKRPEFCPIKRQRIVAGLLLAFVFFVNAIAGIAAREGGLAFLQHEKLAQSIVRNSSHWLREDIGSWHVFETNTWLVGRVRSHVGSLERSLSDFGYTSVREQVELALDNHMAFPLLNEDLVGYQSSARGEPLNERGRPLRWQGGMRELEAARMMHERTRQESPSPFYYVRQSRGLGFKEPVLVYLPEIRRFAARYDIPVPLLLAVMHVESGGRHETTSSRNAIGLMQVQPETAGIDVHKYLVKKSGGSLKNIEVSNVYVHVKDFEQNIRYGATYLHLLERRYFCKVNNRESRMLCMIAAYNMGPGRFTRLFANTTEKAVEIINLYSSIGLYEEILIRYNCNKYNYIDRVISLMFQYRKLGY